MLYLCGDPHFGDNDIIKYGKRVFKNTEEKDELIIKNWNHTVMMDDECYIVGDFGAEGHESEFLNKLNGTKYLIKGNHDKRSNAYYRRAGFAEVYSMPIILDDFWIISHQPMYVNENSPYANIFAHVHSNPMYKTVSSRSYCVCLERNNWKPVSLNLIKSAVLNA